MMNSQVTFEIKVTPTLILVADCGRAAIGIFLHPTNLHGKPAQISMLPLETHPIIHMITLDRVYNRARFADDSFWSSNQPHELRCTCPEGGCRCKVFLFLDSPSTSELIHRALPYSLESLIADPADNMSKSRSHETGAPSPFHIPQRVASFVSTVRTPQDNGIKAVTLLTSSEGLFMHVSPFSRPKYATGCLKPTAGRLIAFPQRGGVMTCATLDAMTGRIAVAEAVDDKNLCVVKVYEQ